ncbi:MAG: family 78 glycoside hydrolase catalytic domain [Clostridia bacterium]|nr:family 78 glycoside hydrolase catalytic domain [Clostridia bacterium]
MPDEDTSRAHAKTQYPKPTTKTTAPETTGERMNNTLLITKPTVNMAEIALGIDTTPFFGWTVTSSRNNNAQSAYQIKVFSSKEKATSGSADVWDSGKVESAASTSVTYGGEKLASTSTYYWTVTVWDTYGNTAASKINELRTGIFAGDSWQGEWITAPAKGDRAATLLRKEFTAKTNITEATVYMSGIGYSLLRVNGTLADDSFLDPCNTQYNKTVLYRTFDVTELLTKGNNAIAVELGNGFFKEEGGVWNWGSAEWKRDPMLLFYMIVKYADGTSETLLSDTTWKATTEGPTTFNSIYYGEYYDARLEKTGWDKAGYDDSAWLVAIKATAPKGKLECQTQEPVRRAESFKATEIKKLRDGSYVVYCPEMVAGWIKLNIKNATAGETITVQYAEKINKDGSIVKMGKDGVNGNWWRETYIMTDKYTAKGEACEVFEPKFSYKGFAYIQIFNYPGELTADDIVIYRIRNDVETTGQFESSNKLINDLHQMMLTTVLNNLQGKPTDTPVWEKNGWLGDFNVGMTSMTYNYDMRLMSENFVEIMESCFEQYGLVPPMVPTAGWNISDHFVWSSVYILAVAEMYDVYGSLDYVKEQYDTMKKFAVNTSRKLMGNGWVCADGQLGDWVSPMGNNPNAPYTESPSEGSGIVGTAMLYLMYDKLANMADLLGKTEDAQTFRGYMEKIYEGFNKKFYVEEGGYYQTTVWTQYGTRTRFRQTSQILPLAVSLVPDEYKDRVLASLIADIKAKGNHLDTGCVGAKFILPVLSDLGYADLAYKIATQTTYPSWGFMIENGATSLWEMWELTSRSVDHYFLGTYEEWFYSHLAGIRNPKNGYESFTIQPHILGDLTYVTCKLNTVRGEAESSWTKAEDGSVTMKVTVPFGSTATVIFPLNTATVNSEAITTDSITLSSGSYEIICK